MVVDLIVSLKMVIDSGVTVMSCQFRKWVGKIAHLVLKMGRENYLFGMTLDTLRAAQLLSVSSGIRGGGPRDQWGGKITYFGPKINRL